MPSPGSRPASASASRSPARSPPRCELLLVDEPTARLDEENARLCSGLLARAAHERRLAVVCATHDPVLIEAADEVVPL